MTEPVPYLCPHCKTEIGLERDGVLYLAGISIAKPVRFKCMECGRYVKWVPCEKIGVAEKIPLTNISQSS